MSDIYQALARTALLIELDIFGPGADHHAIIDGLRDTTARIITDRANIDTPAGQTVLVTLFSAPRLRWCRTRPDRSQGRGVGEKMDHREPRRARARRASQADAAGILAGVRQHGLDDR